MTGVYGNDNTIYHSSTDYIKSREEVQAYQNRFHIPIGETGLANDYASILSNKPRPPALALLMGTDLHVLWARCEPPPNYYSQPISSPYILARDLEEVTSKLISAVPELQATTPSQPIHPDPQIQEGGYLLALLQTASYQNEMIATVRAAMESFLKG